VSPSLTHGIMHILEGVVCHSTSGMTKAHWDNDDYTQMALMPLLFATEEIDLIHPALAGRSQQLAAAQKHGTDSSRIGNQSAVTRP
jgi:hypothetical protein